jgi:hypothetical protein
MVPNLQPGLPIWTSFAKALYRILALDWGQQVGANNPDQPVVPPFEVVQELIEVHIMAYLDHPGTLPYNGFDPIAYYTVRGAGSALEPEGARSMLIQQAMLEELTRVWLEFSGVQDKTPYALH